MSHGGEDPRRISKSVGVRKKNPRGIAGLRVECTKIAKMGRKCLIAQEF